MGAAEEGLLHLKRSRLLREIEKSIGRGEEQGAGAGAGPDPDPDPDPEPEPGGFPVGGKCVFLHTDGRWYAGLVVQREGAGAGGDAAEDFLSKEPRDELRVTFLHPTAEKQQVSSGLVTCDSGVVAPWLLCCSACALAEARDEPSGVVPCRGVVPWCAVVVAMLLLPPRQLQVRGTLPQIPW